MSAAALVQAARSAGLVLSVVGPDQLKVVCAGALPAPLVEALRAEKPAVIEYLSRASLGGPVVPAGIRVEQVWDDHLVERAAIVEYDAGIPRAWAEGFARLAEMPCPAGIPPRRWRRFVDDAGRFLDQGWGAKAAALGWGPMDLLGCDRYRPWQRIDLQGLLWVLDGAEVIALTETTATTRNADGARLTFRRVAPAQRAGGFHAWELS